MFGLLSSEPNYCLLMVAANNGLVGMSKYVNLVLIKRSTVTNAVNREHLGIALALNVPVMVCITKIDICPPQILQQTITQLTKILKSPGARKIPVFIKSREECINTAVRSRYLDRHDSTLTLFTDSIRQPTDMSHLPSLKRHWRKP